MPDDEFLKATNRKRWTNHHKTVSIKTKDQWVVRNESPGSSISNMRHTAARIQRLIARARTEGVRLRAHGSRWSFSEIAAVEDGWSLETGHLNHMFRVAPDTVDPQFAGGAEELVLAQCGRSISEINREIESPDWARALRTSGASNGQTIAGALGTGTHGSAVDVGAMESQVVGVQLLSADRNLWIERASQPVMTNAFAQSLGADLVRDDLLFEAALVGLGALGVVHAALFRTTGRYLLKSSLKHMPFSDIEYAMNTLDFRGLNLTDPTRRPYFFMPIIDPGNPATAYVTVRYKESCPADHVPDGRLKSGYEVGNDLPGLIGTILDAEPRLRQAFVSLIIKSELAEFAKKDGLTPGVTYSYTTPRSGVASTGVAVPIGYTTRALEIGKAAFASNPGAPIVFSFRYVQKSPALLGFTKFDPTCVIDVDGIDSQATRSLMEDFWSGLDAAGIPYAFHWGKLHGLTPQRLRNSYGGALDKWALAREQLLPNAAEREIFSNNLTTALGL